MKLTTSGKFSVSVLPLTFSCCCCVRKRCSSFQVLAIATFIRKFIDDNPLCVCSDEISTVKRTMLREGDEIKLKQKTSQVSVASRVRPS